MNINRNSIRNANGHWNAHSNYVRSLLGLKGTAKLPTAGMPSRIIQGVLVWVNPAPTPRLGSTTPARVIKSSTHRVMCRCPQCGWEGSVGRLHQHKCKEQA